MPIVRSPSQLAKARKNARIVRKPEGEAEERILDIADSNASLAVDQRLTYDNIEEAFECYLQNLFDTMDEEHILESPYGFARDFAYDTYRARFAQEADRRKIKVPDALLGIEKRYEE